MPRIIHRDDCFAHTVPAGDSRGKIAADIREFLAMDNLSYHDDDDYEIEHFCTAPFIPVSDYSGTLRSVLHRHEHSRNTSALQATYATGRRSVLCE